MKMELLISQLFPLEKKNQKDENEGQQFCQYTL